MSLSPVVPVDPRVYAILAEAGFGTDLFNPRQHRSCELVEHYVLELVVHLIARLDLEGGLARRRTVAELLANGGLVPAFHRPLRWLLERLAADGLLERDGTDDQARYRLPAPLPSTGLDELRAQVLASDASYAPTLALLDEAAAVYPRVASGEITGERALFQKVSLWSAYFSNRNGYYALNNRVTARVAAARLPPAGATVLELGAGLGSATEALLDELAARGARHPLAGYRVTEPVPFFRRRTERALTVTHPDLPLVFADLDLNQPWRAQGIEPGTQQLVWAVNVFHLARDLDATLREARAALAPGGWLVIGEGVRPAPGQPVGAEFPFQLLERFGDVALDPETRPTPGFLTAEHWLGALARAGFAGVETVPDVVRLRALYPGFLATAVCGRRP